MSPYSYWDIGIICCCSPPNVGDCKCNSRDCDICSNCDCSGDDGGGLLIAIVVVVLLFVTVGIIVGAFITFVVVNKIVKRHLMQLENKARTAYEVVVDLDDPIQVNNAGIQFGERIQAQLAGEYDPPDKIIQLDNV